MSWNDAYLAINILVLPAWALLVLAPKAQLTRRFVHSMLWPVVMGVIYTGFLVNALVFGAADPDAGFGSVSGISALFAQPNGVLTGWTHYLVFDLFVGAWIGRDAQRRGLHHAMVIPCQLGAWIFGPVGLTLYALLRLMTGNGFRLEETVSAGD